MARELRTVGVVGLGTMGAGIVEVFARSGVGVVAVDSTAEAAERGRAILQRSTERAVSRGRLAEEDRAALLARVRFADRLEDLAEVDLVIEAVPEHLDLKRDIFVRLDDIVAPDAILATNTSSLSVTRIAVATQHPARVVGMHFFNPAPVLKLVEVVGTVVSDDDVVERVRALAERLGKKPVVVGDRAGFIANALLFGYLNHAVAMLESGYASREDIDDAMRVGCGLPMGPLALMDLIGLDTGHEICETMYQQGRDRLHAPSPLLGQLVTAGLVGRKSGRGFYTYEKPGSGTVVPDALTPAERTSPESVSRPVARVGVVGAGTTAATVVDLLTRAGVDVVHATGPGGPTGPGAPSGAGLADLAEVDLVVEALGSGDPRALFSELDRVCRPGAVLVTTATSCRVIDCAAATARPQDVVGLHLFGPGGTVALAEVVHSVRSADDAVATVRDLCRRAGVQPVGCGDRSGGIVNALLFPYLGDAVAMLEAHYAGVDDIDTAMTAGCGYPAGPFAMLDALGLDTALAVLRGLYEESREPGLSPAPLLQQLVTAGHLGRATGRGFRTHEA